MLDEALDRASAARRRRGGMYCECGAPLVLGRALLRQLRARRRRRRRQLRALRRAAPGGRALLRQLRDGRRRHRALRARLRELRADRARRGVLARRAGGRPVGAVAPEADHCPHCDAGVAPGQEYCLECGARLPHPHGVMPALAGAWRARLRWYPGDWIWAALVLLVVAAAGAAVAVASTGTTPTRDGALRRDRREAGAGHADAPGDSTPTPAQQRRNENRTHKPPKKQKTLVAWPFGRTAYTVVLSSYPSATGAATANGLARQRDERRAHRRRHPRLVALLEPPSRLPGRLQPASTSSADDARRERTTARRSGSGSGKAYTRADRQQELRRLWAGLEVLVRRAEVAVPAAGCAGTACPCGSLPGSAGRRRRTAPASICVFDERDRRIDPFLHDPGNFGLRRDREVATNVLEKGAIRLGEVLGVLCQT